MGLTVITNQPDPPEARLGDCILHRTHHAMGQDCWRAVMEWNVEHGWRSDVREYKAAYERALLNDITNRKETP